MFVIILCIKFFYHVENKLHVYPKFLCKVAMYVYIIII